MHEEQGGWDWGLGEPWNGNKIKPCFVLQSCFQNLSRKRLAFKKSGWMNPTLRLSWHSLPKSQRQLSAAPIHPTLSRNWQSFSSKSCQKIVGPILPQSQVENWEKKWVEQRGEMKVWHPLFSPPSWSLTGPTVNFKYHPDTPLYEGRLTDFACKAGRC